MYFYSVKIQAVTSKNREIQRSVNCDGGFSLGSNEESL